MVIDKEAKIIEQKFFEAQNSSNKDEYFDPDKILYAWNYLYSVMIRENRFDGKLGNTLIDWQIGNWAGDADMTLWGAKRYNDVIALNEQILSISWEDSINKDETNLFHENAKRQIADAYAQIGNIEKCFTLYEKYLHDDPKWGWGWIGYFRQLHDAKNVKFKETLVDLHNRILADEDFRDKQDLCRELAEELAKLQ